MQSKFSLFYLVIALCFANAARADIIGLDNRISLPASETRYAFVGKFLAPKASCTATLVREDAIVTNAHCVLTPNNVTAAFKFVAYKPGSGFATLLAAEAELLALGTRFPAMTPEGDWALLRLNQPLGAQLGWARVVDDRKVGDVSLVSFASDFNFGLKPSFEKRCQLVVPKQFDFFGAHNCDTYQGASGAPLFREDASGLYLVGLNAAGVTPSKNDVFNISVPTFQFKQALDALP